MTSRQLGSPVSSRPLMRKVVPVLGAFLLFFAGSTQAADVVLKNDGWTEGSTATCQAGFIAGDAAAVGLKAPVAQEPFKLKSIKVLVCEGSDTYGVEIYSDALDNTADPEALIFPTGGPAEYLLTGESGDQVFNSIDLSSENIMIDGGFRVALRHVGPGAGAANLTIDADGITNQRNFIHTKGTWSFAENLGVAGDFVIRATYSPISCQGKVATHIGTNSADPSLTGTASPDVLVGLGGKDGISGLGGGDRACAGPGPDVVKGGNGEDRVNGDSGNDRLSGNDGDDIIRGGDGDDTLVGGPGRDTCDGGNGRDETFGCEVIN